MEEPRPAPRACGQVARGVAVSQRCCPAPVPFSAVFPPGDGRSPQRLQSHLTSLATQLEKAVSPVCLACHTCTPKHITGQGHAVCRPSWAPTITSGATLWVRPINDGGGSLPRGREVDTWQVQTILNTRRRILDYFRYVNDSAVWAGLVVSGLRDCGKVTPKADGSFAVLGLGERVWGDGG